MKNKNGLSAVISTILLILMTIVMVSIIAGVIIPFLKERMRQGKECYDVMGQLEIDTESGYTCYYNKTADKQTLNITIKRGQEGEVAGIKIAISGGGTSEGFEIKDGETVKDASGNIQMINGTETLELPKKGEERTYSIDTGMSLVSYATIAPLVESGEACKESDTANIEKCPQI